MQFRTAIGFVLLLLVTIAHGQVKSQAQDSGCTLDRATGTTIAKTPFMVHGYSARWNAVTNRIAFMEPDASHYYRVYTMQPDGSDRLLIAGEHSGVSQKHQGSPYWHPSGRFLTFIAQKPEWKSAKLFGNPDYEALPGFGRHDDLWIATSDGKQSWQLISEPNTKDQGVLVAVFSPNGKRIAWSSRQPGGTYEMKVAEFVETPQPHLEEVKSYSPGGKAYYETGSFTSDSASLLYASDQDTHSFWQSQIYRLDLQSGQFVRLTEDKNYNEHPTVVTTPSGDWVIYMSTKEVDRFPFSFWLGTDWWAMKTDGSQAKRLTSMNVRRKDNPHNMGAMQVAGTVTVSPGGDSMLGDIQDSLTKQTGMVRSVRFTCE
jgi:Tol biopolymer transport system component